MKVINIQSMKEKNIKNTLNEIRILCSIENPYICGYKEVFLDKSNKNMCIVMEFIGGGDM